MGSLDVSIMPTAPARDMRGYFPIASLLLLALTLVGFSDNLVTDVGQPSNSDPKFIVHGLFCLAWMVLLVIQATLVRAGNVRLHRKLGIAGMVIAVGVTLSTTYVFWAVWTGWGAMSPEVRSNRLLLPAYAVLIFLAFRQRGRPDRHKRLIYVASLYMLGPVLGRAFDPMLLPILPEMPESAVDMAFQCYFFAVWHLFFLSLLLHDWRTGHCIHPVSAAGYGLFCMIWAVAFLT